MPFPLSPRRTYDELVSIERARVLSYRADNIVTVDCDANDPAGEMEHVSGAAPFSVLNTPSEGWSHLWIDALDGLFDESHKPRTLAITPYLLLHVTVLPQYWLNGDFAAANQALSRAWCVPAPSGFGSAKLMQGSARTGRSQMYSVATHEKKQMKRVENESFGTMAPVPDWIRRSLGVGVACCLPPISASISKSSLSPPLLWWS